MMGILIPLFLICFCCLFIWRACDGFELASEYIGRNLSEGVRGGTINAISSSLPEVFTTLIALFILADRDGFAIGIGATAGSALFNGMIIPAACILAVVGGGIAGQRVASVDVSLKVLLRDGLCLIFCEFVLVLAITGSSLTWRHGLLLMGLYFAYFAYMTMSMKRAAPKQLGHADAEAEGDARQQDRALPLEAADVAAPPQRTLAGWIVYWLSLGPMLDFERWMVKDHHREQMQRESWNGWPLLIVSTAAIGAACWVLVTACEWLGAGDGNQVTPYYELFGWRLTGFGMPAMFVAVIFASMATSVPDTVISIRDARDGDYDDAVANALGSNVFDICFALGFPLFAYTMVHGPIELSAEVQAQSAELRLLLLLLTVIGFLIYYIGPRGVGASGAKCVRLGRAHAWRLLVLYGLFVAFVIGRGNQAAWAEAVSRQLQAVLGWLQLS